MIKVFFIFFIFIVFIQSTKQNKILKNVSNKEDDKLSDVITLPTGNLQGTLNHTVDLRKPYYAFRGIPYAVPPVGDLRFEPPIPANSWNGTLLATQDKSECIQGTSPVTGSEDCLFINVYTPNLMLKNNSSTNLPVMVFIYGGAFVFGHSTYNQYGPDYFLEQDVVIVLFNYRLGVFGFSSTGDLSLPGNTGLKDQILALKWVKTNIEKFGGDSNKITIFGESAGSASVSYLLQSNKSKDLFHGAIMESGTSLCLWSLARHSRLALKKILQTLGFNVNDTTHEIVANLKKVDSLRLQEVSSVISAAILLMENPLKGFVFSPVIEPEHEGAVFSGQSHNMLSNGQFHKVPTIIGFNSEEGAATITSNIYRVFLKEERLKMPIRVYLLKFDLDVSSLPPVDLNISSSLQKIGLGISIKNRYWGIGSISLASPENTITFIGDNMFNRPIRETVLKMSKHAPVYFYKFSYIGELGGIPNRTTEGAHHAEELNYLFRRDIPSTEQDRVTRSIMIKMWTNFAKYLNPTPKQDTLLQNITWLQVKSNRSNLSYLNIDAKLENKVNPFAENMFYWDRVYNKYGILPFDTY